MSCLGFLICKMGIITLQCRIRKVGLVSIYLTGLLCRLVRTRNTKPLVKRHSRCQEPAVASGPDLASGLSQQPPRKEGAGLRAPSKCRNCDLEETPR